MVRSRQFSILFRLFGLDVYRCSAMKKAPVMVSTEETDATQRLFQGKPAIFKHAPSNQGNERIQDKNGNPCKQQKQKEPVQHLSCPASSADDFHILFHIFYESFSPASSSHFSRRASLSEPNKSTSCLISFVVSTVPISDGTSTSPRAITLASASLKAS